MPVLVRWYIRTALLFLAAAVAVGSVLLFNQSLRFDSRIGVLLPVFYHLMMVGWVTQLIAGVAIWMFPLQSREQPRGNEQLGWFVYATLNLGLLLRALAEPFHGWQPQLWTQSLLVVSAVLQALGIWALVVLLWPRVRGKPERDSGKKGE